MPGLVRKVLIFAAVDGLVLQPLAQRGQRNGPSTKISYKDNNIGPVLKDEGECEKPGKSFEAFGIVGESSCGTCGVHLAESVVLGRPLDGIKVFLPSIYNTETASRTNTRKANLRCH
jgi:hypothetical protein